MELDPTLQQSWSISRSWWQMAGPQSGEEAPHFQVSIRAVWQTDPSAHVPESSWLSAEACGK